MGKVRQALPPQIGKGSGSWPIEIRALLASLQTQSYFARSRRASSRQSYEVEATLWYKDANGQVCSTVGFTRDATPHAIALMSQVFFKSGQSVILEVPAAEGMSQRFQGHIRRCRQFREGWFDCVMQIASA